MAMLAAAASVDTGRKYAASTKPFLRWAGSKRLLIPKLSTYWTEPYRRYIEPFVGSAALFFALQPASALLSDINPELVRFLKEVQTNATSVYDRAAKIGQDSIAYYAVRALDPRSLRPVDRAARFYYLNRLCFNGIYRTNENGMFNVPYSGSKKRGMFPSREEFFAHVSLLQRAQIHESDFEQLLLKHAGDSDFVYLDPPYAVANRRIFRQYGANSFGLDDLKRLSDVLDELDRRKARFVLSYAYCAEAIRIFSKWRQRKIFLRRNVSGFAHKRRPAAELVISNIEVGAVT